MKRGEQIPIDPLPEATWQRIERHVLEHAHTLPVQSARKSRRVGRAVVIAVVLQVAAAVLVLLWPRSDVPSALTSGRVVTEASATETMLGDVSIRVEPSSALMLIEGGASNSLVVLEHGAAHFSVPARGKRSPFAVHAGEVRVEVVGTRFRVERRSGLVRVDTYEGKVRVVSHGESTFVSRDESWSDPPERAAPAPPAAPVADAGEPARARATSSNRDLPAKPGTGAEQGERRAFQFDRAARLEASDPAQAQRLYRALVSEGGRWGEPALYALARLSLELGDKANAERLLEQYLERHPRGANASDVRSLIEQLTTPREARP